MSRDWGILKVLKFHQDGYGTYPATLLTPASGRAVELSTMLDKNESRRKAGSSFRPLQGANEFLSSEFFMFSNIPLQTLLSSYLIRLCTTNRTK